MKPELRAAYEAELLEADSAFIDGDYDRAFHHLQRAHILGHQSISRHVCTHLAMLRVGIRRNDWREIRGQLLRVPAAALGSALRVPSGGNTGGANIGFFARQPIPNDLKTLLDVD